MSVNELNAIAYDTETTGLELHTKHKMFAYSTASYEGATEVVRLDGKDGKFKSKRRALSYLDKLTRQTDRAIVCHNAKFDLTATEYALGRRLVGPGTNGRPPLPFHDTYIQAHLFMSDHPSRRLKDLAWELGGYPKDDETEVKRYIKGGYDYSEVPPEIMTKYQERDAVRAMLLHRLFYPKIQASKELTEIYQAELDLIPVTMAMERRGFMINRRKTRELIDWLKVELDQVLDDIEGVAGMRFNPDKRKQLSYVLFDKLGLPVLARTPKSKEPKTSKEILARLRDEYPHPILDLITKFRSYRRGVTILGDYLEYADDEGIIHPDINTCKAVTSRESASRPNLQNVEKTGVLLNPYPVPARRVFRPRPGYILFFIDYAGIEMRLLIHYSREPKLIDLINNGGDPHSLAAEIFYGDRFRNAKGAKRKTLRGAAKNANFAIPYGASALKVATILGMKADEGALAFGRYRQEVPGLVGLTPKLIRRVKQEGEVITAFGRRLRVARAKAYTGTNYLIQGTAAGILKRAQVRVAEYLERATGGDVKLLLPVHDEIILEYPRDMLGEVEPVFNGIREVMIDFNQFDIPLEVEAEYSTIDWESKREYKIGGPLC